MSIHEQHLSAPIFAVFTLVAELLSEADGLRKSILSLRSRLATCTPEHDGTFTGLSEGVGE